MGGLQELSLLTGIISKTALPGTETNRFSLPFIFFSLKYIARSTFSWWEFSWTTYHDVSGVLEMSGEINSSACMEFQGHIHRFQV